MPKLSIITINYNNKTGLEKTIYSVINQTSKDFEYIIIDGGSTDGSKELIEQYSDKLTYWVCESDSGIYHAMNKGNKIAQGEYLLFLNSGDWLYSNTTVVDFINQNTNEDIVYGNSMFINNNGKESLQEFPNKLTFYYFFTDTLNHQSIFMKKRCLDKLGGFDESFKILADWKSYTTAICLYNMTYKKIPIIICYYNTDGISFQEKNQQLFHQERQRVYREDFKSFHEDYKYIDQLRKLSYSRIIKFLKKLGFFPFFDFKTPR